MLFLLTVGLLGVSGWGAVQWPVGRSLVKRLTLDQNKRKWHHTRTARTVPSGTGWLSEGREVEEEEDLHHWRRLHLGRHRHHYEMINSCCLGRFPLFFLLLLNSSPPNRMFLDGSEMAGEFYRVHLGFKLHDLGQCRKKINDYLLFSSFVSREAAARLRWAGGRLRWTIGGGGSKRTGGKKESHKEIQQNKIKTKNKDLPKGLVGKFKGKYMRYEMPITLRACTHRSVSNSGVGGH